MNESLVTNYPLTSNAENYMVRMKGYEFAKRNEGIMLEEGYCIYFLFIYFYLGETAFICGGALITQKFAVH